MKAILRLVQFMCLALLLYACTEDSSLVGISEKSQIATLESVDNSAGIVNENFIIPWEFEFFSPCANYGQGEILRTKDLYLHFVEHKTFTPNGGGHVFGQAQPHGNGYLLGLTTGDKYQSNGITRENGHQRNSTANISSSYINNFMVIGPGPDNNFLVKTTIKLTYNANDQLTANTILEKVECK